ncbi:hypothetical protein [Dyadobacter fermentans]|uniref:Secreted protein n=1 Tax=Dyadobacter fermentans (strain ATCC 700827 / DSM 18053 / CIP 107007 / KCTC 52180 / NS114) TaxID=471854 RepID=C6VXF6_DYAFD|nr:hypothetical protein [Dyadobacter fermentans]ACT93299.1 hypothetical protein Dfer_2076 [Dyadobacter fermentans DSM 18053]
MLVSSFQTIGAALACLVVAGSVNQANAQGTNVLNTYEFVQDGVNNSYQPPVIKGPTSIPQTLAFFYNKNGSVDEGIYFQPLKSALSVTFSFDDQTYINVPQHVTGMTFGAASGASSTHVRGVSVVNTNYYYADTARAIFTAHPQGPVGKGVNLFMNAGLQVFLSAKPLLAANASRSDTSRYYYGKLRLQFSRPVTDPVISFIGLGATTNFGDKRLGFATELELQTPGLALTKLSGSEEMQIDMGKTQILHSKTPISGNCDNGAACGSVVVKGSKISTLVFGVYLRPDGGPGVWGTEKVSNSGDMWHVTISLPEQE